MISWQHLVWVTFLRPEWNQGPQLPLLRFAFFILTIFQNSATPKICCRCSDILAALITSHFLRPEMKSGTKITPKTFCSLHKDYISNLGRRPIFAADAMISRQHLVWVAFWGRKWSRRPKFPHSTLFKRSCIPPLSADTSTCSCWVTGIFMKGPQKLPSPAQLTMTQLIGKIFIYEQTIRLRRRGEIFETLGPHRAV